MTGTRAGSSRGGKADRLLSLSVGLYEPRKATRWPYLLREEEKYRFEGPDRRRLEAQLRADWRDEYPDEPAPSAGILTAVIADLRRLADQADPDPGHDDLEEPASALAGFPVDRGLSLVTRSSGCVLPDGYVIPAPYVAGPDGIHVMKYDGTGLARVSWNWLFPLAVYADPDGDQLVELAWRDQHRWVTRLVRRAVTRSGRKLIAETGDAGLPVVEADARLAERWLAAAEAANHAVIPRHPVARQLGWQADGTTFVTGQDSPWRVEPRYTDQVPALTAHHPSGTGRGWQDAIAITSQYPVVRAGAYAGLASPLLRVLGLDSFTVDVSGRSTRGKTITAMVALSCWADPGDRSEGMLTWSVASVIGVEKRLNLINGLTVVVDETRLVREPALVDAVLYMIPKNHGRPRGGNWPNMIPWHAIVVSTGEQPATSFTTHQGASARVLTLQSPPFGTDGQASREAAESVKAGIEENYGLAGPAFAGKLRRELADGNDTAAKLRDRHAELTEMLRGGSDMMARRAPFAACMLLAGELAHQWGIMPYAAPDPAEWASLFTDADQRDNRPEMALDLVREYLAANPDRMWNQADPDQRPPSAGWIGQYALEGPGLFPANLRKELRRHGYELDAVIPGWLENGALVTRDSQRPSYEIPRRTAGQLARLIIFNEAVISPDPAEQA